MHSVRDLIESISFYNYHIDNFYESNGWVSIKWNFDIYDISRW